MGNVLSANAPNDVHWVETYQNDERTKPNLFGQFIMNALVDIKGDNDPYATQKTDLMKRACCMNTVGDVNYNKTTPDTSYTPGGIAVPIANIVPKGRTGVPYGDQLDETKVTDVGHAIKVLSKNGMPIRRLNLAHKDATNNCTYDDKLYNRYTDHTLSSEHQPCDSFYNNYCKNKVIRESNGGHGCGPARTTQINSSKQACNAEIISSTTGTSSIPEYLFANKKNPAFYYPDDCSCVNSPYGQNYGMGVLKSSYGPNGSKFSLFNYPAMWDVTCLGSHSSPYTDQNGGSYANKRDSNELTYCENNISLNDVKSAGDMKINIQAMNECSDGGIDPETFTKDDDGGDDEDTSEFKFLDFEVEKELGLDQNTFYGLLFVFIILILCMCMMSVMMM